MCLCVYIRRHVQLLRWAALVLCPQGNLRAVRKLQEPQQLRRHGQGQEQQGPSPDMYKKLLESTKNSASEQGMVWQLGWEFVWNGMQEGAVPLAAWAGSSGVCYWVISTHWKSFKPDLKEERDKTRLARGNPGGSTAVFEGACVLVRSFGLVSQCSGGLT